MFTLPRKRKSEHKEFGLRISGLYLVMTLDKNFFFWDLSPSINTKVPQEVFRLQVYRQTRHEFTIMIFFC